MGWRVHAWREAYKALPAAQEALQAEIACGEGSECLKRALAAQAQAEAASQVILRGYEDELEALRNRPRPVQPIRLCRPRDPGGVPNGSASSATSASGGAELPVEVGRDIAVELYRLADDADAEALKLKALWSRDVALSQPGG